jgi:hypothetical protein
MEMRGLIERCNQRLLISANASDRAELTGAFQTPAAALGTAIGTSLSNYVGEAVACGGQPGYEVPNQPEVRPVAVAAAAPIASVAPAVAPSQPTVTPTQPRVASSLPVNDRVVPDGYQHFVDDDD